jgi:UDP-2-acetamido-2-deoxy-ribo-hexuluronate aminotransferase
MKHILLDVNVVVDLCVDRPGAHNSRLAVAVAKQVGLGGWVYVGSVQTLEYVVGSELRRVAQEQGQNLSPNKAQFLGKQLLAELTTGYQWLAALSDEGNVFADDDPEDAQLLRSLDRFPEGRIFLLTRDKPMLKRDPRRTITPEALIETYRQIPSQPLPFLDLPAQQDAIRPDLEKRIHTVLHHGKYILGPEVVELETRLCDYTGAKHSITCSSGTDALLMALMALEVGPGDAVFTTPFTFVATADVIARLGATPVFVDIDPATYNLDPIKLEAAIVKLSNEQRATSNESSAPAQSVQPLQHIQRLQPKCIIAVDLYGLPCDYDAIDAVAKKYGMAIIQDGAQSFGATYNGRQTGTLGDISCTSFFPSKPLGGYGDGGACFTNNDDLTANLRSIRVHGQGQNKYDTVRLGIKGRMDTLQAAIVLAKLEIYPKELEAKQRIATLYAQLLSSTNSTSSTLNSTPSTCSTCLKLPFIPPGMTSAWALYTILCPSTEYRTAIQAKLAEHGIPNVVYYAKPLHLQPVFAHMGYKTGVFPVAEDCAKRVLSLPMHGYMGEGEIRMVVDGMKGC